MYIKHNSIIQSMVVASVVSSHAFEVVADFDIGMQTGSRQLVLDASVAPNLIKDASARKQIASSMGYLAAEYVDFTFGVNFEVDKHIEVAPHIEAKILNKRLDVGVNAAYVSEVYKLVKLSTFVDVYQSIFYDEVDFADRLNIDIDYGLALDVELSDAFDMRMKLTQPLVFGHNMTHQEIDVEVMNRNHIGIGLVWHVLSDYTELPDDYFNIIQEPISIPRIELVEDKVPVAREAPIALASDIEEVDEEAGWLVSWFNWLVELVARLFRF